MKFSEIPYQRPDIEVLKAQLIKEIDNIEKQTDFSSQEQAVLATNELRKKYLSQQTLVKIRFSVNSNDEFYKQEQDFFDQQDPSIQDLTARFYHAIVNSKFLKELEARFGKNFIATCRSSAKTSSPEVVPLLEKENALVSDYEKLMAGLRINYQGKDYNLVSMGKFTQAKERATRLSAHQAIVAALEKQQPEMDRLYDELVKLRVQIATKLGYKNFIELAFDRFNRGGYTQADVKKFRDNILLTTLAKVDKLVNEQKKRLGLEELFFYDLSLTFPEGNPTPQGGVAELSAFADQMYAELSEETKEFWRFMQSHELMDLPNRDGKFPGGYATLIYDQKFPFIFANFNGTAHDVEVLTHEVGHTFQAYCSRNFELIENIWPTLEACEIHSEAMELLTHKWMPLFFKDQAERFKYDSVTRMLRFLPYAACVDHFQESVFENPSLTPVERRKLWRDLEKKYLPHKNYAGIEYYENGSFWQIQRHIYVNPFYYIDYALAWIGALQIWLTAEKDFKLGWKKYLDLCKLGGSYNFFELIERSGLKSPFELETFQEVMSGLDLWVQEQEQKI